MRSPGPPWLGWEHNPSGQRALPNNRKVVQEVLPYLILCAASDPLSGSAGGAVVEEPQGSTGGAANGEGGRK
jgi:hypothetical protein